MRLKRAKNWYKSNIHTIEYLGENFGQWEVTIRNMRDGYEYTPTISIKKLPTKPQK